MRHNGSRIPVNRTTGMNLAFNEIKVAKDAIVMVDADHSRLARAVCVLNEGTGELQKQVASLNQHKRQMLTAFDLDFKKMRRSYILSPKLYMNPKPCTLSTKPLTPNPSYGSIPCLAC